MAGGFAVVLSMPAPDAGESHAVPGPARRARPIVLLGIGMLPLLVLPIAYALTFEDMTLSEADLARVREAARAWQAAQAAAPRTPRRVPTAEPVEVGA